ncbi:MAG: glycogen synthase [Elusimicrobia bacterium]|nr:glycogen synthase [Elusimicrobiota bacterium]
MRGFPALLALLLATPALAQFQRALPPVEAPVSVTAGPASSPLAAAGSVALPSTPLATLSGPVLKTAFTPALAPAAPKIRAPLNAAPPEAEALAASAKDVPASTLKAEADADFARRMGQSERPLNVLMVGAESVPYIKTGGLADVVDAVSRGLVKRGHDVKLILPKFPQIDAEKHRLQPTDVRVQVPIGDRVEQGRLWTAQHRGVEVYFLENDSLHTKDGPYAPRKPGYSDDDERFIFYSRGALEAAKALGFKPDIVHTHDWHSALISPMLKLIYAADPFFAATKTVLTLHNLAYQGMFGRQTMLDAGFKPEHFTFDNLEYWGHFNFLKSGLVHADALTTVSPTYALQIQGSNEFGRGMEGLLNYRFADLHGILNGIDPELWDPETDEQLRVRYRVENVGLGKAANKAALQSLAHLDPYPDAPIFAVASRFDSQKGLDLVADAIPGLVERGAQVIVSGSGDPILTERFHALAARYPGKVHIHPFSETFVHPLYAGADFVLMPSRFEPCGLTQLIAQRYGTLPIVNPTGGLADTVTDAGQSAERGDGFYMQEFSPQGLLEAADRALALRADASRFEKHRRIAMEKDSSWTRAIQQYESLFLRLLGAKRG